MSWSEFSALRKRLTPQLFPCPGAMHTIMVCSHIWWTEQIGLAFLNAGLNVLFQPPFYLLYTDPAAWPQFDKHWQEIQSTLRSQHIDLIFGGNSSALLIHPKTRQLIHHAAGADGKNIPVVSWWWDEIRANHPLSKAGISPADFLAILADPHSLNAIWDIDVKEELESQYALANLFHLPLATLPEYWPHGFVDMQDRPLTACFLGNCHFDAAWTQTDSDPLLDWARDAATQKAADPNIPMQRCIDNATTKSAGIPKNSKYLTGDPWTDFSRPWELLNAAWMHIARNQKVLAAANHLKGKLALIGKGWDALALRANMENAGEKSGVIYGQSHVSLNLFGGCVHGGLPLRPYDIATSGGLILTHNQRELPNLFTPNQECLAFNTQEEMLAQIDRVRTSPKDFNPIAQAARRRVQSHHTWLCRIQSLLTELRRRNLLP